LPRASMLPVPGPPGRLQRTAGLPAARAVKATVAPVRTTGADGLMTKAEGTSTVAVALRDGSATLVVVAAVHPVGPGAGTGQGVQHRGRSGARLHLDLEGVRHSQGRVALDLDPEAEPGG